MTTNTQQTAAGWCCTDCLILFANGETPPELDEKATAEWLAKIDRSGETVTLGLMASEHSEDCPNVDHATGTWLGDTDCSCETQEFSRSSCDTCRSPLGGSRHAITFWL